MKQENRYVVTMEVYVYADNDYMARRRAHKLRESLNNYGRNPSITEIGEQPFASFDYRKLEDISEPIQKTEDKPLPF